MEKYLSHSHDIRSRSHDIRSRANDIISRSHDIIILFLRHNPPIRPYDGRHAFFAHVAETIKYSMY